MTQARVSAWHRYTYIHAPRALLFLFQPFHHLHYSTGQSIAGFGALIVGVFQNDRIWVLRRSYSDSASELNAWNLKTNNFYFIECRMQYRKRKYLAFHRIFWLFQRHFYHRILRYRRYSGKYKLLSWSQFDYIERKKWSIL